MGGSRGKFVLSRCCLSIVGSLHALYSSVKKSSANVFDLSLLGHRLNAADRDSFAECDDGRSWECL